MGPGVAIFSPVQGGPQYVTSPELEYYQNASKRRSNNASEERPDLPVAPPE
jgi:hypothetical protein